MPVAVTLQDTERFDLKSLPEGFVRLRRMNYGQKLQRRADLGTMKVQAGAGKDVQGEIQAMSERITLMEFGWCIVEHNLTDTTERPLNFSNPADVRSLDGRVGEEIDTYISKMNNFEEEDEANPEGNF